MHAHPPLQGKLPRATSKGSASDGPRTWTKAEIKALEDALVLFGRARQDALQAALPRRSATETSEAAELLLRIIREYAGMPPLKSHGISFQWTPVLPEGVEAPPAMHKVRTCAALEKKQKAIEAVVWAMCCHELPCTQALCNADTLKRLRNQSKRYMDALQEMAAIAALLEVGPAHGPGALLLARPHSPSTPWWDPRVHNVTLLRGCFEAGYIPSGNPRRSVVRAVVAPVLLA